MALRLSVRCRCLWNEFKGIESREPESLSLLFVEAFGTLIREADRKGTVSEDHDDLYSVFSARAELMGWAVKSEAPRSSIWNMNEAKLDAGIDGSEF